jgi:hypothetical protein
MKLDWENAPKRTQWGAGMKEALVELDKDHTLSLYAEDDALHLVPAALARLGPAPVAPPPVQLHKLVDLPLGARFRFPGNPDVFVLIDRHRNGIVVREPDLNSPRPPFQGLYSATDTAEEFREITVEVLP